MYLIVADLIRRYSDYDSFAREWHSETLEERDVTLEAARERDLMNERDTRQLWQLLGLLDEDRVFIQLPKWLAEEKSDDARGDTPTTFVGYISRETEDAILFEGSSPSRRLMRIAHRIHTLERGIENTAADGDRREQLNEELRSEYQRFETPDDEPYLADEWLPKSQLIHVIQRESVTHD